MHVTVYLLHLRTVLIVSIVHHGHRPLLPVFDAWRFLCIKKAGLVPVEFANHTQTEDKICQCSTCGYKISQSQR